MSSNLTGPAIHVSLKGNLYCNPVVGELQGGIGTIHSIREGPRPDAVLIPEPLDMKLLLKHAGVLDFAITALGSSNHTGPAIIYQRTMS